MPRCFPDGDDPQKRRGDWRWSRSCKRWKTSLTAKLLRWCGDGWIGNMRCPCRWMIRGLTPAFCRTFVSACSSMGHRISCSNPFCRCAASTGGGTTGGKQRTDATFVLANVRGLSSLESVGEDSWHLLQAALDEQAPPRVRDCPSLILLQQVWHQHFRVYLRPGALAG